MNHIPVAGIDVSKHFSDMCILTPDNSVYRRIKIYHDLTSMQRSIDSLREAEKEFGSQPVVIMESTSHYHRLLWQFLSEAGYEVIVINPIQSGGLKNIQVRKVKNDKVDAYRIALLYRLKLLRPSIMPTAVIQDLRALGRQHWEISHDITRHINRLTALLDQAFPGFTSVFCRLTTKSALAVLESFPTPRDILGTDQGTLITLLVRESKKGVRFATDKTAKLIAAAKNAVWLGIRRNSDGILISSCIATIKLLMENMQAIDAVIAKIVLENPIIADTVTLLQSIPGVGEYSAIVLLAEMGDFSAFAKPKQLAAYFGLDPSQRQSGTFQAAKNKMSKRGSPIVRGILNMVAHNCIHRTRGGKVGNPVLAAYYEKKRLSKPHKVAICAVMHKIINIIFAILRDQKPFELRMPEDHDRMLKERNKLIAA